MLVVGLQRVGHRDFVTCNGLMLNVQVSSVSGYSNMPHKQIADTLMAGELV
jgi:hypothetical protein